MPVEKDSVAPRAVFSHSEEHNYVVHKEMVHLEIITLSKIIQAQEDKFHIFSHFLGGS